LAMVGVDVFLDSWELEVGDSLHRSLAYALQQSRFVGIVISPEFAKSEWCIDELSEALAREKRTGGKTVIPIVYQEVEAPATSQRQSRDGTANTLRSSMTRSLKCGIPSVRRTHTSSPTSKAKTSPAV
jgi:hypothetical protein